MICFFILHRTTPFIVVVVVVVVVVAVVVVAVVAVIVVAFLSFSFSFSVSYISSSIMRVLLLDCLLSSAWGFVSLVLFCFTSKIGFFHCNRSPKKPQEELSVR